MGRLFGTDGIRGEANREPLTPETALRVGKALVKVLKPRVSGKVSVALGRDTRLSGPMLESALAAGICSQGGDVRLAGVVPTPAVAFLAREDRFSAGVMISASHNPYGDNGIKIFSGEGFKLSDDEEDEIADAVLDETSSESGPIDDGVGWIESQGESLARYEQFCCRAWPLAAGLEGMRLVLDCGNGATWQAAPAVFRRLGARIEVLHAAPDGININDDCGSQHTASLRQRVVETSADAGLAFDGDGDRLIAVDEKGNELTGDHEMAICARFYRDRGMLRNNLVVTTVMSNFGFGAALKDMGVDQEVTAVGDRYVLERMRERGAVIGGEASGHVIFLDRHTTGDGIVSAVQLLAAMRHYEQPLSALSAIMRSYPQRLVNVEVTSQPPLEEISAIQAAVAEAEEELGEQGRVLIRYSGTQPLCRVMVEASTPEVTERITAALVEVVRDVLG